MATYYGDLDNDGQLAVERALLTALEQCGLDHHFLDPLIDTLDGAVDQWVEVEDAS